MGSEGPRGKTAEADEPALGRSLAETAALNDPARLAGQAAAASVRRAAQDQQARHRRRFRGAILLLVGAVALCAGVLLLLEA